MPVARYVGIAEEDGYNQATPPAAVVHMDIASASLDAPSGTQMVYGGGLQRSPGTTRPGFYSPAGNLVYAFDIRTIGFLLKWVLGGYVFTSEGGAGTLNLHEFYGSGNNILPSFCTRVGKDYFEHVFSGCVINSLELKVEGEFCEATADIVGAKDSKAVLRALEALTLPDEYPLAFYEVTAVIGGTAMACEVKGFTLTINNNQNAESGRGIGSRYPCRIVAGERQTAFAMDLFYEGTEALEKLWGGQSGPTDAGPDEFAVVLNFDGGAFGSMQIELPRVVYNKVNQQPSGRNEIVQSTEATALLDTIVLEDLTPVTSEIAVRIENDAGIYGHYPGTISGITQVAGPTPLPSVTVIADTGESTISDAVTGAYSITVKSGTRSLTFSKTGYVTDSLDNLTLTPGGTLTAQNIILVAV